MKRFYKEVAVAKRDDGWQVTLDGRGLRTQRGAPQIIPSLDLAETLAAEWRAQGSEIDIKSFVYRDLADFALDIVAPARTETINKLLSFAETDTLCYQAAPDDAVFGRQQELWEPLIAACEARHAIRLERASGIVHQKQPEASLAALRARLEQEDDFTLAGLQTLASLTASLITALAVLEDGAQPERLFTASNAEEDWQAELWGWDSEAEAVRQTRLEAFENAARFIALARNQ